MLKLYHAPISFNSRRVWVALLEKEIPFELVDVNLGGDQFQPEFLTMNPFHHIPVLVDDGFGVVESLAILDYLEAKYPTPALLPTDAKALAIVRMVEMITINELVPTMGPLIRQMMGVTTDDPQKLQRTKQQAAKVLSFFEHLLGEQQYFGGEQLTLAEVVAGTAIPLLPRLGVSISDYPQLRAWTKRLMERTAWQQTQPSSEAIAAFSAQMKARMTKQQTR